MIRGAAAEIVLQSEGLPEVQYDRRRPPQVFRDAVLHHLVEQLQPRVQQWLQQHLSGEMHAVHVLHELVKRYNEVLLFHSSERMTQYEYHATRLPMDGNEALGMQVQLDDMAQQHLLARNFAAIAEQGPAVSLDAARIAYQHILHDARQSLIRALVPVGAEWNTDQGARNAHSARLLWMLLPFAYRHAEEYVAQHRVAGTTTDMPTLDLQSSPIYSDAAAESLHISEQEYRGYTSMLDRLSANVTTVRRYLKEHTEADRRRTALGRALSSWLDQFPEAECRAVLAMVDAEHRIDRARQLNSRIHLGWTQVLALEHTAAADEIQVSYRQIDALLVDFPARLGQLVYALDGGYEGK